MTTDQQSIARALAPRKCPMCNGGGIRYFRFTPNRFCPCVFVAISQELETLYRQRITTEAVLPENEWGYWKHPLVDFAVDIDLILSELPQRQYRIFRRHLNGETFHRDGDVERWDWYHSLRSARQYLGEQALRKGLFPLQKYFFKHPATATLPAAA